MIGIVDTGRVGVVALLDVSSAFGTVDHDILGDMLQRRLVNGDRIGSLTS
jgi:hypothetical protein